MIGAARLWVARFWAGRYWPKVGETGTPTPTAMPDRVTLTARFARQVPAQARLARTTRIEVER